MLYPQSNAYHQMTELSGYWDFRTDPNRIRLSNKFRRVA